MSPTLENGSTYLLDRTYYRTHSPRRGDVVVFDGSDGAMIKRIAAVPGDTIFLLRTTGPDEVLMDWQVSGIKKVLRSKFGQYRFRLIRCHVPDGYCYVLGDNLEQSMDSRAFGLVSLDTIRGHVVDCPRTSPSLSHLAGVFHSDSRS